ncbi:MAG: hypothetical protein M1318_05055 [Firmicutes bacterium]|nr:hypothetical protein [Bacillota bacterium]
MGGPWSSQGVVSTTDGGLQWTAHNPKTLTTDLIGSVLENIATAFPSSNEAVIAQETTTAIHIWITKDEGIHWTSEVWKPSASIIQNNFHGKIQMQFTTAQTGWMILASQGNAGSTSDALLQTTDGGINWRVLQESSPGSTFENVDSVAMRPSGGGMASVNTVITGRAETLMTTDGGQSWVSQKLPFSHVSIYDQIAEGPPDYQGAQSYWLWVSLFNDHTNKQRWLVEHTSNGGAQWTSIPWNQSVPQPGTLGGVYLWPQSWGVELVVADSHGTTIWKWTRDASWQRVSHLPLNDIQSVSLLPNGAGWIIGDTQSFLTTNVGATWHPWSPQFHHSPQTIPQA